MDSLVVETVDGELLEREHARGIAKKVFLAGFAGLPFLWAVNVWMFWPDFRHLSGDEVVRTYTRRSAACFAGATALLVPWLVAFAVAGPSLLGQSLYDKLDAYGIDLNALGIGF